MFSVIPEMGLNRKKGIEAKLEELQRIDDKLRYQIRLGNTDSKVFVKIYHKGEYNKFRELPLVYLDPNNKLDNIKTFTSDNLSKEESEEESESNSKENNWNSITSKQSRRRFQKIKENQRCDISNLQLMEFIYAYVKGTQDQSWKHFLMPRPEDSMEQDYTNPMPGTSSGANL